MFHQTTHRRPHCCFPNAPHDMPPMFLYRQPAQAAQGMRDSLALWSCTLSPWLDRRGSGLSAGAPRLGHRVAGRGSARRNAISVLFAALVSWLGCLRVSVSWRLVRPLHQGAEYPLLSFGVTGMAFTALPRLRSAAMPLRQRLISVVQRRATLQIRTASPMSRMRSRCRRRRPLFPVVISMRRNFAAPSCMWRASRSLAGAAEHSLRGPFAVVGRVCGRMDLRERPRGSFRRSRPPTICGRSPCEVDPAANRSFRDPPVDRRHLHAVP